MWNVPFKVIQNIQQILDKKGLLKTLPLRYTDWLHAFGTMPIEEKDGEIVALMDKMFALLKERKTDYHIMNLENLLVFNNEEDAILSLNEKMEKVYASVDFASYQDMYRFDIQKKKRLLMECIKYVSAVQNGDFLLLKYRPEVVYYDLWNEFYMEARGVVVDIKEMQLVSSPYRKFFNLNEKPETSLLAILDFMKNANSIIVKNKEDGSMISCSRYKDELVVATPGSLTSKQALWAKDFIENHHPSLKETLPGHLTFIFEAVYPDNRIVVDYGETEALILTNIRNKETGRLLDEQEIEHFASLFQLPTPKKESQGLLELMEAAKDRKRYPANDKEGWVFIVRTPDEERLFKLKCDDYCEVHRIIFYATSPKIVFQKIKSGTFDDFYAKIPEALQPLALKIANVVLLHVEKTERELKKFLGSIPPEWLCTQEETNNHRLLLKALSENILPQMNPKLPKQTKMEIEQILLKRTCGKEAVADKWTMQEADRLWAMIPDELKDQKTYKEKSGQLIGYIKRNIPPKYQPLAFNYVEHEPYNIFDVLKFQDIDFSSVSTDLSTYEDQ